jgi:hypothetical protein
MRDKNIQGNQIRLCQVRRMEYLGRLGKFPSPKNILRISAHMDVNIVEEIE